MKEKKERMNFEKLFEDCQVTLTEVGKFARSSQGIGNSLPQAKRMFFGSDFPEEEIPKDKAQRFLEWFLIERVQDEGVTPLSMWLSQGTERIQSNLFQMGKALEKSLVGLFEIKEIDSGKMELEDVSGRGSFMVALPMGEHRARVGDTLIGRLVPFPKDHAIFFAMGSTQVFRGGTLFSSIKKRLMGRSVEIQAPLSSLELERILDLAFQPEVKGLPKARKEMEAFLKNEPELPSLKMLEDALRSVTSPGKVLDPFLEAVAFYTKSDIGEARRLGLELWNAIQLESQETQPSDTPTKRVEDQPKSPEPSVGHEAESQEALGAKVLRELEEGEARGENLETLFDRLGAMVGLQWEAEDSIPEKVVWSTSEVGDLAALFLEYRWELSQEGKGLSKDEEEILSLWSKNLKKDGETFVSSVARLRWAQYLFAHWMQGGASACRKGIKLLCQFSLWLQETQDLQLDFPTEGFLEVWDRETRRCERILGASSQPLEMVRESERSTWLTPWFVKGKEGGIWVLESGNRRMTLGGDLDLVVGDRVFGKPIPGKGTFETGFRVLPSCLALLAITEV